MSRNDQKIPFCEYNLHKKNGEQQYNIVYYMN